MKHTTLTAILTALFVAIFSACQPAPPEPPEEGMVPLFDGKTLEGWEQKNGAATYEVVDGAILGTTVEGSPNSFLCTTRDYGDFILEYETLVDPVLNSGVQIRAHQYEADTTVLTFNNNQLRERKHEKGRIYGYQVETSNEKSGASGGIFDEARRGWVANISSDPVASKAFKDNQWNHYRVEAIGDRIKVFVNGVPCADLVDSWDLTGFIGLQVHGFRGEKPAQVRWRNIWIKDLGEHTWEPLTDGKTLNGWTPTGDGKWEVVDGVIKGVNARGGKTGMLMSDASYSDLTVRLQFKAVKGNSGFFFRTVTVDGKRQGLEAEIDEAKHIGGYYEVGGRKYVVQPTDEEVARYFKPGEWNSMTVSAHGRHLVFRVNGRKTVDLPDDPGRLDGQLGLQVHAGAETWFKGMEILKKK